MQNFAPEFKTPEQYIIDITYQIWEERGAGKIRDWYAADCPVHTPHGVTNSADDVIKHTLETMHEFPDRELLAEDIIIGEKERGFLSSHRVRSPATHANDGAFGPATYRSIYRLAVADCLCQDNQIVAEWLIADQAAVAQQLGLDPVTHGYTLGARNPNTYTIGNESFRARWSPPHGLAIDGDSEIAQQIIDTYAAIWTDKQLNSMSANYDRALRFEGFAGQVCYGLSNTANLLTSVLASIPDGVFEPHHVIVREEEARPIRVALRWSYGGDLSGYGRYGLPTHTPLTLLGISHFELRDGRIVNEWLVVDETAVYAQIEAYSERSVSTDG
ncbi:MAG: ester cyclase [Chloroflexota bacterium]